jgi:uncharacterized membrane protein required for colicin V production
MLDIGILLLFIIGLFMGIRRGFILQLIHMVGFIAAIIIASLYFDELAPKLTLWIPFPSMDQESTFPLIFHTTHLDSAFYRAIAFAIIFFAVIIVFKLIGSALDFLAQIPVVKQLNTIGGGLLGLIEMYLIVFILLYVAALIPIQTVQSALNGSFLANIIIHYTPVFSDQVQHWWIEYNKN